MDIRCITVSAPCIIKNQFPTDVSHVFTANCCKWTPSFCGWDVQRNNRWSLKWRKSHEIWNLKFSTSHNDTGWSSHHWRFTFPRSWKCVSLNVKIRSGASSRHSHSSRRAVLCCSKNYTHTHTHTHTHPDGSCAIWSLLITVVFARQSDLKLLCSNWWCSRPRTRRLMEPQSFQDLVLRKKVSLRLMFGFGADKFVAVQHAVQSLSLIWGCVLPRYQSGTLR